MNFVEKRTQSGVLIDIRVQHISVEKLLDLITALRHTTIVRVARNWPAENNEAARFQVGKQIFRIETSFADMFIAPMDHSPSEEFEALAAHLRVAKEKYLETIP